VPPEPSLVGDMRLPEETPTRDRRPHHTEEVLTMSQTLTTINQEVRS
jgi:hypothetical protein